MSDETKKQMHRFQHLIGFKGKLDVTSRENMRNLIDALGSKYKSDVQNSVRLHRLEFLYDLAESRRRRKSKDAKKDSPTEDAVSVHDWKDLMTLSKIYYVLEHPRSEGLQWNSKVAKKKFDDLDLIEWRVAQNFRLRGLEEWHQRRSDARRLAAAMELDDFEDIQSEEMDELFRLFDPRSEKIPGKKTEVQKKEKKKKKEKSSAFKFQDECIEDWTESYSEDSEYSDIEDFVQEIDDFPDELERKIGEFEETRKRSSDEEMDVSELLSTFPEYSRYRDPIFEEMDEAKTIEEWYELYNKAREVSRKLCEERERQESSEAIPQMDINEDKEAERELRKGKPLPDIAEEDEQLEDTTELGEGQADGGLLKDEEGSDEKAEERMDEELSEVGTHRRLDIVDESKEKALEVEQQVDASEEVSKKNSNTDVTEGYKKQSKVEDTAEETIERSKERLNSIVETREQAMELLSTVARKRGQAGVLLSTIAETGEQARELLNIIAKTGQQTEKLLSTVSITGEQAKELLTTMAVTGEHAEELLNTVVETGERLTMKPTVGSAEGGKKQDKIETKGKLEETKERTGKAKEDDTTGSSTHGIQKKTSDKKVQLSIEVSEDRAKELMNTIAETGEVLKVLPHVGTEKTDKEQTKELSKETGIQSKDKLERIAEEAKVLEKGKTEEGIADSSTNVIPKETSEEITSKRSADIEKNEKDQ